RLSVAKPMNRAGGQPDEVVGVLWAQLTRQLELGCSVARKLAQRVEVIRTQQPLIEERSIELLHVLFGLQLCIVRRRLNASCNLRQSLGDLVERWLWSLPQPFKNHRAMLSEAHRLTETLELRKRVAAEAPVDFRRNECVSSLEDPFADWIERARRRNEQRLQGIWICAERLAHRLSDLPQRRASVRADEVEGRLGESNRPGERQREEAANIRVRTSLGESPRVRTDGSFEHGARAQRGPERFSSLCKTKLSHLARNQFVARVARNADSHDLNIELVAVLCHDAPQRPFRDAALSKQTIDAGHHVGPVRQRDRQWIEMSQPFDAELHQPSRCASRWRAASMISRSSAGRCWIHSH